MVKIVFLPLLLSVQDTFLVIGDAMLANGWKEKMNFICTFLESAFNAGQVF